MNERIKAGLIARQQGQLDTWSPEAHAAAAKVRQAKQGTVSDDELNRLALQAALDVDGSYPLSADDRIPEVELSRRPVSMQMRRGHGQEGSNRAHAPGNMGL